MNTSYSSLNTFRSCPLKYKFQEIDRIKTPKGPEAFFGTLIHGTMKFIHQGGFLPPSEKDALNHFSSKWNSDVFDDPMQERAAFAQGVKIIQGYYRKFRPDEAKIVALESYFSVEIKDEKGVEHIISGSIDRIDKTEDGFEIIDYKTAKKMPSQELVENDLQLFIYLLALLKRYPEEQKNLKNIKLSLFFLHHQAKLTAVLDEKRIKEGKTLILDLIGEIEKSDFPAVINPLCDWCGYQKTCPMWKHKFKKEDVDSVKQEEVINEYIELYYKIKSNKKRFAEVKSKIDEIMENEEVEQLFSSQGSITKRYRKTFEYDEASLRRILGEKRWLSVLKLNESKLKKVAETLPSSQKKEIEKAKKLKKETFTLGVKSK
ncbi:MAG TPA: PD-(D/E)XK nuclease family protein [Candidatus Moranbacteria bacterium]|nr:PD-(D/E)XK nuclease family protein [Candidatus Moranbacteria bacterium]